ncbi:MAG: peptidyl-prolyl cis-trans isomerase [Candidatus Omnitrophica bacterium]|nr:peptidyl-prolyl cis-trans isomerase [Candidatus Omnitrophota bacterium]
MLKILRKKGVAKKLLWIMAVMITVSFVFFGISSSLMQPNSIRYAGEISGKKISMEDFQDALMHVQNQAIMRYGENFFKIKNFLDLESEAWDRLILLREGKKRKIKIANNEVIKTIANLGFFKRDGKFDPALYNQIVQYVFKCSPRDFEEGIRGSLVFTKIYEQETDLMTVSDEEALEAYKNQNEKIDISYVLIPFLEYQKNVQSTDEEIASYYQAHQNNFKTPPMINVEYLALEYPKDATDEQKINIESQADNLTLDLNSDNIDFLDLAKKYDLKVQESGFFSQENPNLNLGWPLEIFQEALSIKPESIAGPIKTSKGFYVLKLKEQKEPYVPELDQVKDKVKEALAYDKSKELAKKKSEDVLEKIKKSFEDKSNQTFDVAAKQLELKAEKPAPFTRGQYLPGIGTAQNFHKAAFALTAGNRLSDPTEISTGYCIVYLNAFVPIDENAFEEKKEELKTQLLEEKKNTAFKNFLDQLRQKSNLIDNIKKLKEEQKKTNS